MSRERGGLDRGSKRVIQVRLRRVLRHAARMAGFKRRDCVAAESAIHRNGQRFRRSEDRWWAHARRKDGNVGRLCKPSWASTARWCGAAGKVEFRGRGRTPSCHLRPSGHDGTKPSHIGASRGRDVMGFDFRRRQRRTVSLRRRSTRVRRMNHSPHQSGCVFQSIFVCRRVSLMSPII
jgi:hypothetical protein